MDSKNSGLVTARIVVIVLFFLSWCAAIVVKQLDLQVHKRDFLLAKKAEQQKGLIKLIPRRGVIYDRRGRILAMSVDVDSIYAVPFKIKNIEKTASELSRKLNLGYRFVLSKLTSNKTFVWIKRKVEPAEARAVLEAGMEGIHTYKENKRYYPHGTLAASLIGFAGVDNDGLAGCEYQFDKLLKGKPGAIITTKDARRNSLSTGQLIKAVPTAGKDIYLTIDSVIQHYLECEMDSTARKLDVKQAFGIIMDPRSGEILAMASYPGFDLNNYFRFSPDVHRNRAINIAFEPGSTFKLATAASAIENNRVALDEKFYCGNGSIILASQQIKDHKPFGILSFEDILVYSSNIGIIKVGLKVGKEPLYRKLHFYGFGEKTGIDLPGENPGILRDVKEWSGVSIGSISFGQELSINGLQMTSFVSAIVNGGSMVKPRILAIAGDPGASRDEPEKKIMSKHTAKILTEIMEKVVIRGTGKKAQLDEYLVAGKTGTAQKVLENGRTYEEGKYVSSFIGFAPADDPKFVMYLVFDEPKFLSDGGDVAAPVFRNVALNVLRYMKVPAREEMHFFYDYPWAEGQKNLDYLLADFRSFDYRKHKVEFSNNSGERLSSSQEIRYSEMVIPDFTGKGYRQVLEALVGMNLMPDFKGTGLAYDQYPKAGSLIKPRSSCMVFFRNGGGS
jgi:cell division protein FtsI (penicillin-binding protein 3)